MQDDCIAVALGLPQLEILWQKELERHIEVTVIYRRGEVTCPRCGMVTTKEHGRMPQHKQDRRLRDKVVFLTLIKRRFRCLFCGKIFTEPDEIFGELDRAEESLRQTVTEPLEEAVIWMISREEFERLLGQKPAPVIKLTKRLGLETREIKTEVKELVFKDVPDRLVEILLRLANDYGETHSQGIRLRIRLSYQELANLTASTKKAILLALSVLKRKGLIDLKGRDIFIKDKEGLVKLCSSD